MSQAPDQTISIPENIYDMENFFAKKYDKFFAIPEEIQNKLAENLYNGLALNSRTDDISILSIGPGTGRLDIPFLKLLCQKENKVHFVAVEPSKKMLDCFREKLKKIGFKDCDLEKFKNGNVSVEIRENAFSSESSESLKSPTNASGFDVILALFVLHVIPNWQDAFLAMFKLLKPGGSIVLAEECGDIQWLDNRFSDMQRVRQIWNNKENDNSFQLRWFHYRFWREYHRLRQDILGKSWDPEISASDLGSIKAALCELDRLGYGKWQSLNPIEWDGNEINIKMLLELVGGKKILFTPLLLWGLTKEDLEALENGLQNWVKNENFNENSILPRKEGHKFYIYQKPSPEPAKLQNTLAYLLRNSSLSSQRLVERIDSNKIKIERKQIEEKEEKEKIYSHACNRLSLLYQQHFRGHEPVGLAYVSWDIVRGEWRSPLPILIAGIPGDKIIDFVASYAFYPWVQFKEEEPLTLNQLMLREMPESFIFCIKRVNSTYQDDLVKLASYRRSGYPVFVEIKVPIELNNNLKNNLQILKNELRNAVQSRIIQKLPVMGKVAILNYEDFLEGAKSFAEKYSGLRNELSRAFECVKEKLVPQLKNLFQFFKDAYAWSEDTELEDKLAHLLPRVFLIGATTDYWLHEIQWIPGKGILEDDREQAFGGIIVLKFPDKAKDETSVEELNKLTLVQTLEGSLDGIREQSRYVRYQVLSGGTRAAVTSLGGRNLSHHLGSHILHWLEQEALDLAKEFEKVAENTSNAELKARYLYLAQHFKAKALFYAYLRERMDLVASMAIYLPTWTVATPLKELIAGIKPKEDSLVLRHIGQSEGVYWVDVIFPEEIEKEEIKKKELAIPGSAMGKQAFYGLLENIARDAAKYGDIQSERVVIVTKITNSTINCKKYSSQNSFPTCFHLNKDPTIIESNEISEALNNLSGRALVIKIKEEESCKALRQLSKEKRLGENKNIIIWLVTFSKYCHHPLCKVARELIDQLRNNNGTGVIEKASELDRALLSIKVEVSDLEDSDFQDGEGRELSESYNQQKIQEAKENLYRVVIYDDRSSYSTNEIGIREAIQNLEQQGLCDESGRLRPGDWGIKERYIFASYLRGEKPENWLLPESMRTQRTAIPPILRVTNCSGKLGWVFYMLKPKDILIVSDSLSPDDVPPNEKERINVWSWNDLQQRLGSSLLRHKFVILCPKDQNQANQIEDILDYLPYRVFICKKNEINISEKIIQNCALLNDSELNLSNLDLWVLYKKWVEFLSKRFGKELTILSVAGGRGFNGTYIENVIDWINNSNKNEIALFDRHWAFAANGGSFFHYEPYDGGWPVERRCDFVQTPNLRINYSELKLPLQEAALIRILVVDERIDASLDTKWRIQNEEVTQRELWAWKGVDVIGKEYKGRGKEIPDESKILECVNNKHYGFVLLHQGILDKLYENLPNDRKRSKTKQKYVEEIINKIQNKGSVWHIIIHSGRGGVPELPKGVKFLHLSSIEAWFGLNLSKADVIDELMSIRREK